jgi:hypothetical protein
MFWGMIAPEKPRSWIREEGIVVGLGSLVEVRPLRARAAVAGPCVPAALSVWQPEQWVAKSTAPL